MPACRMHCRHAICDMQRTSSVYGVPPPPPHTYTAARPPARPTYVCMYGAYGMHGLYVCMFLMPGDAAHTESWHASSPFVSPSHHAASSVPFRFFHVCLFLSPIFPRLSPPAPHRTEARYWVHLAVHTIGLLACLLAYYVSRYRAARWLAAGPFFGSKEACVADPRRRRPPPHPPPLWHFCVNVWTLVGEWVSV